MARKIAPSKATRGRHIATRGRHVATRGRHVATRGHHVATRGRHVATHKATSQRTKLRAKLLRAHIEFPTPHAPKLHRHMCPIRKAVAAQHRVRPRRTAACTTESHRRVYRPRAHVCTESQQRRRACVPPSPTARVRHVPTPEPHTRMCRAAMPSRAGDGSRVRDGSRAGES